MLNKIINFLKNNIQTNQTLFLIIILIVWIQFYPIHYDYYKLVLVFSTVIFFDYFFHYLKTWEHKFPYSWVNAWFWISFFLRTDELIIYFFAWFIAILSKYIFLTNEKKHFFNPSNFWVVISLLLFQKYTWVNTLQWGNYLWLIYWQYILIMALIITFWFLITYRVYKVFGYKYFYDYLLIFILAHIWLFFIIPYNESFNTFIAFFSTTFFIFTFFMISDPKTVPTFSISRVFFAINIVLAFYILQFFINESYSLIISLTVNTIQLPLIWKLEKLNNKKYLFYFFLTITFTMIAFIVFLINIYWKPDLLFDNVCDKLICK